MGFGTVSRAKVLLMAALAAVLATFGLRAALHGLNWQSFAAQLRDLDPRWLALAVLFDVSGYAAQGVRWRFLLGQASWYQTTRAIYAGLFLNEIIPLRPGEAVRAWLAARDVQAGLRTVAPTMVAERLMDGLWLAAALVAALAVAPLPPALARMAWIVISAVAALVLAAALVGGSSARFPLLARVRVGLHNSRAFLVSGLFLGAQGMAFWAVARASHLSLGIVAAFVVMLVVRLGTMLPGAPANIGTHQFSTVLGLSLFGVPSAAAAGFSIVVFVVLTAPLLAIGLACCVSAGVNWQTVRHAVRPAGTAASPLAG